MLLIQVLRLPKTDFVSNFNIGRKSSCLIYEKINMIPGMTKGYANRNFMAE